MNTHTPTLLDALRKYSEDEDTDVLIYLGNISRPYDDRLINLCRRRKNRKKNLVLILTTHGGDPNAAYRMARCLQMVYSPPKSAPSIDKNIDQDCGTFSILVNGFCKSAGTLIALSADRLMMTGNAELGPLDIQLRKPEEVGERTSGLTPFQAITFLENRSLMLFKQHFKQLRFDADLNFPTKLSAKIATNITKGLLSPIYEQIDPLRLAEVNRSLSITEEYGSRLERNLKENSLYKLIMEYPSHGFVIDREEAKTLFNEVHKPPPVLFDVAESFKSVAQDTLEREEVFMVFLNDLQGPSPGGSNEQKNNDGSSQPVDGEGQPEAGQANGGHEGATGGKADADPEA